MKFRHLINGLPLIAIAFFAAAIYPRNSLPNDGSPDRDRPKVVNVPQERQLSQSEEWEVMKIADGDTITVRRGSRKEKIRLCGIDSPEVSRGSSPGQPLGKESRDYLRQLISQSGDRVAIAMIEKDRYGRWVGEVWVNPGTANEEIANGLLVLNGFARIYPDYLSQCPNAEVLKRAEADARAKKAGVWSDPNSIPPWEFRRQRRAKGN